MLGVKKILFVASMLLITTSGLSAVTNEYISDDPDIAAVLNAAGIGSCSTCCSACAKVPFGKDSCKKGCAKAYSNCTCP